MRTEHAHIALRVSREQKAALDRIADRRDTPLVGVLRDAVASMTGVPDTLPRHSVRGHRNANATRSAEVT